MAEDLLKVSDLTIYYKTDESVVKAVNQVGFTLKKGETLGLVGETGAGKTTTALGIMGLLPDPPGEIISGEIVFEGKNLLKKSAREMRKIRGHKISMIFQDPMTALNPVLTVGDQITEVIRLHEKISPEQAQKKAMDMLELVGIGADRFSEYPHQFSGGMKQRVVIAIALACNPELLVADEPTTALDVTIQAQVLDLMQKLREKYGTSMLMITHDLGIVAEVCDEVSIMYAGYIVEHGTLEDIFDHTAHPYTKGLFDSLPNIKRRNEELKPIPGLMPDPTDLPSGCPFHPRCSHCQEICKTRMPQITQLSDTHTVRCLAYEPDAGVTLGGADHV